MNQPRREFQSRLESAAQRFLAHAVEHGLASGLRKPEEFLRHFSPVTLMRALAREPDRRARILEAAVGLPPAIGLKKSPESSGEDLQIAIDEAIVEPGAIVDLFEPDDRVAFLNNQLLWGYVTEPGSWSSETRDPDTLRKLRAHTAYLIRRAVDDGLLTPRDVVIAISVPTIVDRLPREETAMLLERALEDGRQGQPFTDATVLELVSIETLVTHLPLATLWEWVIGAKIGRAHGLLLDSDSLFDEAEAHPDAGAGTNPNVDVTMISDSEGTVVDTPLARTRELGKP